MAWSQLDDRTWVNTDMVTMKTFSLLYCKADVNFAAGWWVWL
jgi:hypothetical protein